MLFPIHTFSLGLLQEHQAETPYRFWLFDGPVSLFRASCLIFRSQVLQGREYLSVGNPSVCWYSGVLTWEQTQTNLSSLIQRACREKKICPIFLKSLLWKVLLHYRANTLHGTGNDSHYPLLLRLFSNTVSIAEEKSIYVAAFCSHSLSVSGKSPLFYLCPWSACRAHWEETDMQATKYQHCSSLLCPISSTCRDICQLGAVVCWHWGINSSFQKTGNIMDVLFFFLGPPTYWWPYTALLKCNPNTAQFAYRQVFLLSPMCSVLEIRVCIWISTANTRGTRECTCVQMDDTCTVKPMQSITEYGTSQSPCHFKSDFS